MPTALELFERACVSFDCAAELFTSAANELSSACTRLPLNETPIHGKQKRRNSKTLHYEPTHSQDVPYNTVKRQKKQKKAQPLHDGATYSPHFPRLPDQKPDRKQRKDLHDGAKVSPYFFQPVVPFDKQTIEPFSAVPTPPGLSFELQPLLSTHHLIQERIQGNLFSLCLQAILWNKTRGAVARPILWKILCTYPTAESLAAASVDDVERDIRTLGLQRERANRMIDMAQVWVYLPPHPSRRYQRRDYPRRGNGRETKKGEMLGLNDAREGWEIAHLPGIGEYGLDSYRIFGRDRLRGVHDNPEVEPEWKRLVPRDKELGPYVKWKWAQEGWNYNVVTGNRERIQL